MRIEKNGAARGASRVALSLALHGAGLSLVLWMGVLTRAKVVERADSVTVAGVEVAAAHMP